MNSPTIVGRSNTPREVVLGSLHGMPKPPRTPYNFFFRSHRQRLVQARGGCIRFSRLAQTILQMWKDVDGSEKAYFNSLAEQDRTRYEQEMIVWESRQAGGTHGGPGIV